MRRRLLLLTGLLALLLGTFFVSNAPPVTEWLAYTAPTQARLAVADDVDLNDGVDDDSEEEDVDGEDVSCAHVAPAVRWFGRQTATTERSANDAPAGVHREPEVPPPRSCT